MQAFGITILMLITKVILTSLYAENPNSPAGTNISFVYIDNVAVGMSHYKKWWLIDMAEDGCTALWTYSIYIYSGTMKEQWWLLAIKP